MEGRHDGNGTFSAPITGTLLLSVLPETEDLRGEAGGMGFISARI